MIRIQVQPERGETTLHADDAGIEKLREALDDAADGNKVFIGDPGAMLIVRPDGFGGKEAPGISAPEPGEVAQTWAVMQALSDAASPEEIALLATLEAMRLMLVSSDDDVRERGKDGLRGILRLVIESMREHDPDSLDQLVAKWRPQAESMGIEW